MRDEILPVGIPRPVREPTMQATYLARCVRPFTRECARTCTEQTHHSKNTEIELSDRKHRVTSR